MKRCQSCCVLCSGIECDLNINNAVGIRNTHLLSAYSCCKLLYIVKPLSHWKVSKLIVESRLSQENF